MLLVAPCSLAQNTRSHLAVEQLGKVSFATSCIQPVQEQFDRGIALLHSFAYSAAEAAFREVAARDPRCAMAHWGISFSYFHELWDPPITPESISTAQNEIRLAQEIGPGTDKEAGFIRALACIFRDAANVPYPVRASNFENAMRDLASKYQDDLETQVFFALALLANASPADKTHARQKQAAAILEPLFRSFPEHPGIPHYLIHAYDNAELAPQGLRAARVYSRIAPSAPHALHMPSHIFTRLGLWEEAIRANLAAREAARTQGDTGEQLHAMDYLVYAYLQMGRDKDAARVIQQLNSTPKLDEANFKIAYASTAMPVRYFVETRQWDVAASIVPPAGAPPHVLAIAVWARGLGLARRGRTAQARKEVAQLEEIEAQLRSMQSDYWAGQTNILRLEIEAWSAEADGKPDEATNLMGRAADSEDAIEKLPVTPGPILPAREQLGSMLLDQNHPRAALKEFKVALANAPGRLGAARGAARAAELSNRK